MMLLICSRDEDCHLTTCSPHLCLQSHLYTWQHSPGYHFCNKNFLVQSVPKSSNRQYHLCFWTVTINILHTVSILMQCLIFGAWSAIFLCIGCPKIMYSVSQIFFYILFTEIKLSMNFDTMFKISINKGENTLWKILGHPVPKILYCKNQK